MMAFNLSSPVTEISHIAKEVAAQLKHLGILKVENLLFYFPARWDDLSQVTPIAKVRIGERVVVRGKVELIESARSRWKRRLLTQAVIADTSGQVRVVWFNQPWVAKMFKRGDELYLVGELKDDGSGAYFSSPAYERVTRRAATHAARIVPVYPSTEKLSQKQLRFLVRTILPLARVLRDPLPGEIVAQHQLVELPEALTQIHFPINQEGLDKARRRLKFDELFRLQLFAASLKRELKKIPAPKIEFKETVTKKFVDGLPFKLTDDQRKAAWEIIGDLIGRAYSAQLTAHGKNAVSSQPSAVSVVRPMNRLLEGDVGSGKTVVVAIAALNCALAGGQAAIMAPTEILAHQHFRTFAKLFASHNISVGLLTQGTIAVANSQFPIPNSQSNSKVKRREMLKLIQGGKLDVVIGTQALIQKDAHFKNLVLAVVDEQHRFGVSQRAALKDKRTDGQMPHLLTLTATPIPRSLALVFYGDLDISILREMPKGRQKIETILVGECSAGVYPPQVAHEVSRYNADGVWSREQAYDFVRAEVAKGNQVFWTCPIIDPSDTLGVKAATEVFEHLHDEIFPDLKVGLIHGRMRSKEREKVMGEFVGIHGDPISAATEIGSHRIDILVATPVIEVGIDVPNATVMVIEGASRFGLAQLHQFRGRVGRGQAQSHCLLMVEKINGDPISDASEIGSPHINRLKAFLESTDGFELAEKDLALRGPGEVYGKAQSGFPEFKIASFADVEIAKEAKAAAENLLNQDPELTRFPELKHEVMAREGQAHLE